MSKSLWDMMTQMDFKTRCTRIINVQPRSDGCLDLNFTCCDVAYVDTLQTQEKFIIHDGYYYVRFSEDGKNFKGYVILSPEEFEEEYVVPEESDCD